MEIISQYVLKVDAISLIYNFNDDYSSKKHYCKSSAFESLVRPTLLDNFKLFSHYNIYKIVNIFNPNVKAIIYFVFIARTFMSYKKTAVKKNDKTSVIFIKLLY